MNPSKLTAACLSAANRAIDNDKAPLARFALDVIAEILLEGGDMPKLAEMVLDAESGDSTAVARMNRIITAIGGRPLSTRYAYQLLHTNEGWKVINNALPFKAYTPLAIAAALSSQVRKQVYLYASGNCDDPLVPKGFYPIDALTHRNSADEPQPDHFKSSDVYWTTELVPIQMACPGDMYTVQDRGGSPYHAIVKRRHDGHIAFHFIGWSANNDEDVEIGSGKIHPFTSTSREASRRV